MIGSSNSSDSGTDRLSACIYIKLEGETATRSTEKSQVFKNQSVPLYCALTACISLLKHFLFVCVCVCGIENAYAMLRLS